MKKKTRGGKAVQKKEPAVVARQELLLIRADSPVPESKMTKLQQQLQKLPSNILLSVQGSMPAEMAEAPSEKLLLASNAQEEQRQIALFCQQQRQPVFVCTVPATLHSSRLPVLANWFNASKQLNGQTVAAGYSSDKPAYKDRALLSLAALLQPVRLKQLPDGVVLLPASVFLEQAPRLKGDAARDTLLLLRHASQPLPLELKQKPVATPGRLLAQSFKLHFSLFFQKFFKEGWMALRQRDFALDNGNHPLYRLAFVVVCLLALLVMPLLSFQYGMTWDEPVLVEYARDIYAYYSSGGEDKAVFDMSRHARNATMHYSASFDLLAEVLHRTISPFDIYQTRHFLNALLGALTIIFVGLLGKMAGSWRTGLLAALFVWLSPRFFGHSMNNPKDIPFMFGFAASLYFMIRLLKQLPRVFPGTLFWLAGSMAYIISIKIGGLIVVPFLGLFMGIGWLLEIRSDGFATAFKRIPRYALYLVGVAVASYFAGIYFWPWGIEKPLENPLISLNEFSNFRYLITYELFEGERVNMSSPPWHYTFKWVSISVPVFVLAGFLLAFFPLKKRLAFQQPAVLALLAFAFFFPVVYTIAKESTLYSGWRHLMFVYGPMVALAAAGWDWLVTVGNKRLLQVSPAVVLLALMALPATWMVKNHPNQYVYFNETIGGINGAYKQYETEYWCNSMRQAVQWLAENEPVSGRRVRVAANFEITSAQHYANQLTDSLQMLWTRENEKYKPHWDYAFFGTRGMTAEHIAQTFPPKGTIHVIKADSVPLLAIVKREHQYLADAYRLRSEGKLSESLEMALKEVEYDPRNTEALRMAGILYLNLRQYEKGQKMLLKTLALNQEDYAAYTLIGISYYDQKNYKKAIGYLRKGVELKVNNTSAYLNLGRSYMALEDYDNALDYFQKAAEYDNRRNPRIYFDASVAFIRQGLKYPKLKQNRFQLAIQNLKIALEINPGLWDAYKNIAYAYNELGDAATAEKYMALMQQRLQASGATN